MADIGILDSHHGSPVVQLVGYDGALSIHFGLVDSVPSLG